MQRAVLIISVVFVLVIVYCQYLGKKPLTQDGLSSTTRGQSLSSAQDFFTAIHGSWFSEGRRPDDWSVLITVAVSGDAVAVTGLGAPPDRGSQDSLFSMMLNLHEGKSMQGTFNSHEQGLQYAAYVDTVIRFSSSHVAGITLVDSAYMHSRVRLCLEIVGDSLYYYFTDGEIIAHTNEAKLFVKVRPSIR